MDRAIRNVMQFADWSLQHAVTLATRNPARLINAEGKGHIELGMEADLVFLTPEGNVAHTMVGGRFAKD
jgi:N-acetylglucosamine-6-phosphate deacetylase